MDVLGKNLQPAVAHNLGYNERSPSKRIEEFMRDVYMHSRNIFLITRTLEQRLALLPVTQPGCWRACGPGCPMEKKAAPEPSTALSSSLGNPAALQPGLSRSTATAHARFPPGHNALRCIRISPSSSAINCPWVNRSFQSTNMCANVSYHPQPARHVARFCAPCTKSIVLGKYLPEFGALTCLSNTSLSPVPAVAHAGLPGATGRVWEARRALPELRPLFHGWIAVHPVPGAAACTT